MDYLSKAPHKTLTSSRLITMSLKFPRTKTTQKLQILPNASQKKPMNVTQLSPSYFKKLEQLEPLKNGKWMFPQRVESSSPEGKSLSSIITKIKGEFKRNKIFHKASPDILFSKQTMRPPLPRPTFHEDKFSSSPIRQKNNKTILKKIVIVKENIIKEIDALTSKSNRKSKLRSQLETLKQNHFLI